MSLRTRRRTITRGRKRATKRTPPKTWEEAMRRVKLA
jgi:hypothetical protein